jgi:U2-associated protein SR140
MSASTLSLACLPLSTRQSQLRQLLSPHGDIQSIKIHTDRSSSSREFTRKSAAALVTFSQPYEAEKAQSAVDGHYMGEGFRIKASWGDKQAKGTRFCEWGGLMVGKDVVVAPFNAGTRSESLTKAQLSRAPPPSILLVPANVPKWGQSQQLVVRVERPRDPRMLRRIHAVIESVSEYGAEFEALLMEREKGNENYAFLFDSNVHSPPSHVSLRTEVNGSYLRRNIIDGKLTR